MDDNPDDPRFRKRRQTPAIFKRLSGSGIGDTTGLILVMAVCYFIWWAFHKFIKTDSART